MLSRKDWSCSPPSTLDCRPGGTTCCPWARERSNLTSPCLGLMTRQGSWRLCLLLYDEVVVMFLTPWKTKQIHSAFSYSARPSNIHSGRFHTCSSAWDFSRLPATFYGECLRAANTYVDACPCLRPGEGNWKLVTFWLPDETNIPASSTKTYWVQRRALCLHAPLTEKKTKELIHTLIFQHQTLSFIL